jgi:hypothetical protein
MPHYELPGMPPNSQEHEGVRSSGLRSASNPCERAPIPPTECLRPPGVCVPVTKIGEAPPRALVMTSDLVELVLPIRTPPVSSGNLDVASAVIARLASGKIQALRRGVSLRRSASVIRTPFRAEDYISLPKKSQQIPHVPTLHTGQSGWREIL